MLIRILYQDDGRAKFCVAFGLVAILFELLDLDLRNLDL